MLKELKEELDNLGEESLVVAFQAFVTSLPTWPNVSIPSYDQGDDEEFVSGNDEEPLDCENFEINKVLEESIVFSAGGDWQDGQTLELTYSDGFIITIIVTDSFDAHGINENKFKSYFSNI